MTAPTRVVIAPDKFKGSLTALEAASAIADGLRDVWSASETAYTIVPLADGGDGTVAAFLDTGALAQHARVRGPLGDETAAIYAREGDIAIIEMAADWGLVRAGGRRDPLHASTFGTGELIRDALDRGARRIVLGVGGSATMDGGAGALAALGARFLDVAGREVEPNPAGLAALHDIDLSRFDSRVATTPISIACDVTNPLLGTNGATAVYGAQKGASERDRAEVERVLTRFANIVARVSGNDLRDRSGAGAAGGLGWGLAALANATLSSGFALIAELRDLATHLRGATLCITGEGRIDVQTLDGKVVAGVARMARGSGVPVVAFGGTVDVAAASALRDLGVTCYPILTRSISLERAMADAQPLLRAAAARFARRGSALGELREAANLIESAEQRPGE